uniref:KOW domain-containing protein n=1 Tax=Mycena chlorophos TaxID=658473 RepID=A0ABQ0M8L8_MYCCL|nr:predicted protein [Mycena chlorophos]
MQDAKKQDPESPVSSRPTPTLGSMGAAVKHAYPRPLLLKAFPHVCRWIDPFIFPSVVASQIFLSPVLFERRAPLVSLTTILAMNGFAPGTRVFWWDGQGNTVYGTVRTVSRGADNTVYLDINRDSGGAVRLPASSVQKV